MDKLDIDQPLLEEAARAGNPAAMALLAGRLTMTVQSRKSGQHVTIRVNGKRRSGRWLKATYAEATHCFIEVPSPDGGWADKVGTYYPTGEHTGEFFYASNADPARVWAACRILEVAAGLKDWEDDQCTVLKNTYCMYCGRELTDPVSIRRGLGPTCAEVCSSGEHQKKGEARTTEIAAVAECKGQEVQPESTPMPDHRDPDRAGADWSTAEGESPTPGLRTLRMGESAADAYAAMLRQEHEAELAEAAQS